MRDLVRRNLPFFLVLTAAAFALRLLFIFRFSFFPGDSRIYGDLAKNLLVYHRYALTEGKEIVGTLIRVPGYPLFVAGVFKVAGIYHYNAVRLAQMFLDVATCFIVADMARRLFSDRAAKWTFALAAICPFTSNYVAIPLTETPAIFLTALAFWLALRGLETRRYVYWIGCGLTLNAGIYMRPDGGILFGCIGLAVLWFMLRERGQRLYYFTVGALLAVFALGSLAPWAVRNWRVFHVFQPVAPPGANDPGDWVADGYLRWTRTWLVDYSSVEDIGFKIGGEPIDTNLIPSRAFDSAEQRQHTQEIFDRYNEETELTQQLDKEFNQLALERIRHSWFRYHVWLPLLRTADMWLRPRTEMLWVDVHWWQYWEDEWDFTFALSYALLNAAYVVLGVVGMIVLRVPRIKLMMVLFLVIRSAFMGVIGAAEPRYMLECFPVLFVFAGGVLGKWRASKSGVTAH